MKFKLLLFAVIVAISLLVVTCEQSTSQTADEPVTSTQLLQTSTAWNNQPIEYPETESAQITALHIEFAPGSETAFHRHPVASLAYIMSGELEVTIKDGETKIFRTGDAFAEVVNTWHYGKNVGDEPVRLVVFYIGEEGVKLTEHLSEVEEE